MYAIDTIFPDVVCFFTVDSGGLRNSNMQRHREDVAGGQTISNLINQVYCHTIKKNKYLSSSISCIQRSVVHIVMTCSVTSTYFK